MKHTYSYELKVGNKVLEPGMLFRIQGSKSRFVYKRTVHCEDGSAYVDCHGGSWIATIGAFRQDLARSIDPKLIVQVYPASIWKAKPILAPDDIRRPQKRRRKR